MTMQSMTPTPAPTAELYTTPGPGIGSQPQDRTGVADAVPTLTLYTVHDARLRVDVVPFDSRTLDPDAAAADLLRYLYSFAPGTVPDAVRRRFRSEDEYANLPTLPAKVPPAPVQDGPTLADVHAELARLAGQVGKLAAGSSVGRILDVLQDAVDKLDGLTDAASDLNSAVVDLRQTDIEDAPAAIDEAASAAEGIADEAGSILADLRSELADLRTLTGQED